MTPSHAQHTILAPFVVEGIGVHSGAQAQLTLRPAPVDSGIVFVRTDVADRPNTIPARWDHVTDARLCTVLTNRAGVSVSTVEHILSALAALGIDNAVLEIDGPEVPIMDGSAQDFVTALTAAGRTAQNLPRRLLRIKKTVTVRDGDKMVMLSPATAGIFAFDIDFPSPVIGRQSFLHTLNENAYRRDIAAARTFGFLHEVEQLRQAGLARGGSLDNAIVIDGDKVLNEGGLRFADEFVRHKVLDAVGDVYLAGFPLLGRYHGVKAGHAMNNKILHALFSDSSAFDLVEAGAKPARAGGGKQSTRPAYQPAAAF